MPAWVLPSAFWRVNVRINNGRLYKFRTVVCLGVENLWAKDSAISLILLAWVLVLLKCVHCFGDIWMSESRDVGDATPSQRRKRSYNRLLTAVFDLFITVVFVPRCWYNYVDILTWSTSIHRRKAHMPKIKVPCYKTYVEYPSIGLTEWLNPSLVMNSVILGESFCMAIVSSSSCIRVPRHVISFTACAGLVLTLLISVMLDSRRARLPD